MAERGQQDARREATDWLIRQRDPGFGDWATFTMWLEADPTHADHYAELAALDADLADDLLRDPPAMAPPAAAPRFRRRHLVATLAAGAVAAAAILGFVSRQPAPPATWEVAAGEGARRHVRLADGSRIILNAGARVRLDRNAPRAAELLGGEALFDIVHDPRAGFRVSFDGGSVEDLGTRFTIGLAPRRTEIAVAEGAVAYRGGGERVELRPGQRLTRIDGRVRLDRIAASGVGTWATPRLRYRNARLADVAADLSRVLDVPVEADPALADMRVTATIQLELDVERSMARLEPLLSIRAVRREGRWMLEAAR